MSRPSLLKCVEAPEAERSPMARQHIRQQEHTDRHGTENIALVLLQLRVLRGLE